MPAGSSPRRFALNPLLDADTLAERFARQGRIRIDDFLAEPGAEALRQELAASDRWLHVINSENGHVFEIARHDFEAMPAGQRAQLEAAVNAAAAQGFQFQYDTIRVPDAWIDRQRSATLLDAFAEFMGDAETLAFLRRVTGADDIVFADAQATRYHPGDFLTRHDDAVAGKNRRFAYVLGLTPVWQPEWGGLLFFTDSDGDVIDTIVPRFNALSLFAVPRPHSVGHVAPSAPHPRLSVTGWLRTRRPAD